jgi:release factor glutamine methyltransferase
MSGGTGATIRDLLALSRTLVDSDSAALDTDILLAHCLQKDRAYLFAWPEREVEPPIEAEFRALLERRAAGEPIAYITGRREFWSLPLAVNPSTLIPRPDTERLVEIAQELVQQLVGQARARVLDLGTGSGAIALALARENPGWSLCGVDVEPAAVALARDNARALAIGNAEFLQSDWFAALPAQRFDTIVSNPPYIDADDPHLRSGDVRFEPRRALVADRNGLAAIASIIDGAPLFLRSGGWLLFEHGYQQGEAVRALLREAGFSEVRTWRDWADNERVSGGRLPREV